MTEPPPYFDAIEELYPHATAAALLGLIRGAERAGVVAAWRNGTSAHDVDGLPADQVDAMEAALLGHGILERGTEGEPRLTPVWEVLLAESALIRPADLLGRLAVEARLLEALGEGRDYWSLDDEDRLTYARGISPDPFNPAVVAGLTAGVRADPDTRALLDHGTLLELGCGVAGRTLALLQGLPALRVVGVELAPDLAAEALRRAEALGVADRFEVRVEDATAFSRPSSFDVAFWSQFFFPAASRSAALGVLFESLRPGGIVQAPLAADFAVLRDDPNGRQARYYALNRVVAASWGVPERTPEQLAAELEDAGFVDVQVRGGGAAGPPRARGVRP